MLKNSVFFLFGCLSVNVPGGSRARGPTGVTSQWLALVAQKPSLTLCITQAPCHTGPLHCGYCSIKHVEGDVEEEEVSLIPRGNWSVPTMHMGYTPYMGWFPFQWWEWSGSWVEELPPRFHLASTPLPPLKWDLIPFQRWERGGRASTPLPPLKWESPHIWGVSHVHGGQRPISMQY